MSGQGDFAGRSITIVDDLSLDEQLYLYRKTRQLKDSLHRGDGIDEFTINDAGLCVYLVFLEDSTRTKESFRNAAKFHGARVNDFGVENSSINKNESITDTIKMLFGYSDQSLFVIRSKMEGVCRWLEEAIGDYASRIGKARPSFINAGDGKHEHPTQEFLDEFTFLEHREWNREEIHLALIGDLHHGRTAHSKSSGLKIFDSVRVDLVAPPELSIPNHYEEQMVANGFDVRKFVSIEEYLDSNDVADIWYFTRLQLERMGDTILEKADELRSSVTFAPTFLDRLRPGTRFYHPLPRHREHPTIPSFLDQTELNGWDLQSVNGYYTRIVELSMVSGRLGSDFDGSHAVEREYVDDFVEDAPIRSDHIHEYKVGIKPVERGIVIDHIGRGDPIEKIWNQIDKIRHIMDLNCRSSHGVYHSNRPEVFKGIISLPDILSFDETQIKTLGAIAPGCTVNIVDNARVHRKYRLHMPPRIYNFDDISCKNEGCISFAAYHQHVRPEFVRSGASTFACRYCERPHEFGEIWDG